MPLLVKPCRNTVKPIQCLATKGRDCGKSGTISLTNPSSLTPEHFRQLAVLIDSGSDVKNALTSLVDQSSSGAFQILIRPVKRGLPLSVALSNGKFIGAYERTLLEVAECSGKLSRALNEIASFHENRQQRINKLKTRLLAAMAIVLIAVIVGAILAVVQGAPLGASIIGSGFKLVLILVANKFLFLMLQRDVFDWLTTGWNLGMHNSVGLYQRYFEFYLYTLLTWQIEAGIDYQSAFKKCSAMLKSKSYQTRLKNCARQTQQGQDFASILKSNELIFSSSLSQTVIAGEQSGRLQQAISHHLKLERASLEGSTDAIFQWLPRIYYLFVLTLVLPLFFNTL